MVAETLGLRSSECVCSELCGRRARANIVALRARLSRKLQIMIRRFQRIWGHLGFLLTDIGFLAEFRGRLLDSQLFPAGSSCRARSPRKDSRVTMSAVEQQLAQFAHRGHGSIGPGKKEFCVLNRSRSLWTRDQAPSPTNPGPRHAEIIRQDLDMETCKASR